MDSCIFCKILAKEIPNYTVYENDHVLAFLDIHPHAKGHTVVIPKRHAVTLFELSDSELQAYILGVKSAMERVESVLHPDGFTTGWNHGEAGGQAVPHLHIHIFPRWHTDGGKSIHAAVNAPGDTPVSTVAALFAEKGGK